LAEASTLTKGLYFLRHGRWKLHRDLADDLVWIGSVPRGPTGAAQLLDFDIFESKRAGQQACADASPKIIVCRRLHCHGGRLLIHLHMVSCTHHQRYLRQWHRAQIAMLSYEGKEAPQYVLDVLKQVIISHIQCIGADA
jgi:hypothetical protein